MWNGLLGEWLVGLATFEGVLPRVSAEIGFQSGFIKYVNYDGFLTLLFLVYQSAVTDLIP
jgi:hypothetical protein